MSTDEHTILEWQLNENLRDEWIEGEGWMGRLYGGLDKTQGADHSRGRTGVRGGIGRQASAGARDRIQRAYDSLAKARNSGDGNLARTILAAGFESRSIDDKPLTADQWLAEVERGRKEAWRSNGSYEIEAISVDGDRATVGSRHTLLRQAADKEGTIHMVRETDSSRDTWRNKAQGWTLLKSETLLAERDVVQPVQAVGWK